MRNSTPCPDLRCYQSLIAGQLPVAAREALLQHLEECDACAVQVQTLPQSDRLLSCLRQAKSAAASSEDEQLTPAAGVSTPGSMAATTNVGPARLLTLTCAGCGLPLRVKEKFAGQKVKCPRCGRLLPVATAVRAGEPAQTPLPQGIETTFLLPGVAQRLCDENAPAPQAAASRQERTEPDLGAFLAPPRAADELGRLGPYRVLEVLGIGGMGIVFRAEDPQLRRPVALKAMLPALARNESARQRFLREARAAASIKHDHIVSIYQVGEDRGVPFLAMEFLEGESLDDRAKRMGQLPLPEVLRIGREIAEGLEAAHARGLIHRDIKPGNIWLERLPGERGRSTPRFRAKILDFGLARSTDDDVHLTQLGDIIGTPAYMPPEQADGEAVDARGDLYSLGCVLYRLCTGQLPFPSDNTMTLLRALALKQPKSPRQFNPDVPPALADLVLRLLAKDPAQRPATAGEVVEVLEDIEVHSSAEREAAPAPPPRQHELSVTWQAKRIPKPKAVPSSPRRPRALLMALAMGFLLMALLTVFLVIHLGDAEEGTVAIETVDPNVELVFRSDDREIIVRAKKNGEEIKVPIGTYRVELKGGKEGLKLATNQFTLKRGGRALVKVIGQAEEQPVPVQEFEPPPPPPPHMHPPPPRRPPPPPHMHPPPGRPPPRRPPPPPPAE